MPSTEYLWILLPARCPHVIGMRISSLNCNRGPVNDSMTVQILNSEWRTLTQKWENETCYHVNKNRLLWSSSKSPETNRPVGTNRALYCVEFLFFWAEKCWHARIFSVRCGDRSAHGLRIQLRSKQLFFVKYVRGNTAIFSILLCHLAVSCMHKLFWPGCY